MRVVLMPGQTLSQQIWLMFILLISKKIMLICVLQRTDIGLSWTESKLIEDKDEMVLWPISTKMVRIMNNPLVTSTDPYPILLHPISIPNYLFENMWTFSLPLITYHNSMYNHQNAVSDFLHFPQEAFLFRPYHSNSPAIRDDFKIGEGKRIRRLLFDSWAQDTYTTYQQEQLMRLDRHLQSKGIKLDPRWNKSWRLRYMLSTGCDLQKCVTDMERFMGYIEGVRELHPSRDTSRLLGQGLFYIMGRDCHYRPILVFNVQKIVRLNPTEDQLLEMQVYFLEYVIHHYFIPGQVENWVALVDSGYQGLFQLVETMKKSFAFLSDIYRSRLFAAYNVRITTSISIIWGIVRRFLEPETVEKINLFDESRPDPLFQYAHPSQIQVKFGGTMPNIPEGSFWPPREWSNTYKFQKHPVEYMTREEYTQYYNKGILRETKIHEEVLIMPTCTELRENLQLLTLKKLQREFKTHLEGKQQDRLVFQKDIEPYTKLPLPVSYSALFAKRGQTKT